MSLLSSPRSLLVLAVVVIAGLAIPAASIASGPVISENNDTTPQFIEQWGDCPGFTIDATYMADRRNEDFYDAQGNLVLERRHVQFSGVLYNESDPSRSLTYTGDFTLTFDDVANTLTVTGLNDHVIVPGQGVVHLTAGLTVMYPDGGVVEHGPNGDVTKLCTALA